MVTLQSKISFWIEVRKDEDGDIHLETYDDNCFSYDLYVKKHDIRYLKQLYKDLKELFGDEK